MHVSTVQMDPRIAAIHYKDYRKKVREHRAARLAAAEQKVQEGGKIFRAGRTEKSVIEKEDTTLMESYREMARGQRILNVAQVMREFGVDRDSKSRLPLLAIAQCDWEHVWLRHHQTARTVTFSKSQWPQQDCNELHLNRWKNGTIGLDVSVFPAELTNWEWRKTNNLPSVTEARHKALVPAIPVHLRPKGDLSQYHILWEARWTHEAPPDPLLLKHVSGHIYTMLAQWDLTPVEKMVLEGRVP